MLPVVARNMMLHRHPLPNIRQTEISAFKYRNNFSNKHITGDKMGKGGLLTFF
jgi:hypothetical protein